MHRLVSEPRLTGQLVSGGAWNEFEAIPPRQLRRAGEASDPRGRPRHASPGWEKRRHTRGKGLNAVQSRPAGKASTKGSERRRTACPQGWTAPAFAAGGAARSGRSSGRGARPRTRSLARAVGRSRRGRRAGVVARRGGRGPATRPSGESKTSPPRLSATSSGRAPRSRTMTGVRLGERFEDDVAERLVDQRRDDHGPRPRKRAATLRGVEPALEVDVRRGPRRRSRSSAS